MVRRSMKSEAASFATDVANGTTEASRAETEEEKKQDIPLAGKRPREHIDMVVDDSSAKEAKRSSEADEWDEEHHRSFVAAIFEIGLRNSSPAVILENMAQKPKAITSERVKSKLQKYRNNRDKSKQEFQGQYDNFLQKAKAIDCAGAAPLGGSSPMALLEMMGSSKLFGGDAAAFLSYAVMKEKEANNGRDVEDAVLTTQSLRKGALEYVENFAGAGIPFPELTEAEKKSSLGVSMTFVMGIFLSMTQHLMKERSMTESLANFAANQNGPIPHNRSDPQRSTKVSFSLDHAANYALQASSASRLKSGEETSEKRSNGSLKPQDDGI